MSAETIPQEPYLLDLPEDILFTNMLAYHAANFSRNQELTNYSLNITYDGPEPDATRTYHFDPIPRKQEPHAIGGDWVLHAGNRQYVGKAYSIIKACVEKPCVEPGPQDVPEGVFVLKSLAIVRIGRPDLGRTERKHLVQTSYAPYVDQHVIRQDVFRRDGREFKRAAIAPADELKNLHDHMGGSSCACRQMVRYDHYGSVEEYLLKRGFIDETTLE